MRRMVDGRIKLSFGERGSKHIPHFNTGERDKATQTLSTACLVGNQANVFTESSRCVCLLQGFNLLREDARVLLFVRMRCKLGRNFS